MRAFAEKMRLAVAERLEGVTMSFGVSTWHGEGDTMKDLMDRGDRALYRSKEKGRNAVSDEVETGT